MSSLTPAIPGTQLNVRASPSSSVLSDKEMQPVDREVHVANVVEDAEIEATKRECSGKSSLYSRLRPALLLGLAALILGWWISAIILRDTGHRW
jgi:CNT family concentrative nucleoside transporter